MARVMRSMDDDTLTRMRAAADAAGLSLSAWVAEVTRIGWPREVAALVGGWRDLPTAEQLRATSATDLPREDL